MKNALLVAAKFMVYTTCLFLLPFWFQAYFIPMASLNINSIGLLPSDTSELVGLSKRMHKCRKELERNGV